MNWDRWLRVFLFAKKCCMYFRCAWGVFVAYSSIYISYQHFKLWLMNVMQCFHIVIIVNTVTKWKHMATQIWINNGLKVKACWLTAPRHYLNQCSSRSPLFQGIIWTNADFWLGRFCGIHPKQFLHMGPSYYSIWWVWNYTLKITATLARGQWVDNVWH